MPVKYHPNRSVNFEKGVEGMVAALAAERATKSDIKRLQALIEKAEQFFKAPDNDWQKFIKIDVQVHIAIAEIAKNPVFSAVLHMVHEDILGVSGPICTQRGKGFKRKLQRSL